MIINRERLILAIATLFPEHIPVILENCNVDFFSTQQHKTIYRAITDLHEAGSEINLPTVADKAYPDVTASYTSSLLDELLGVPITYVERCLLEAISEIKKEKGRKKLLEEISEQARSDKVDFVEIGKIADEATAIEREKEKADMFSVQEQYRNCLNRPRTNLTMGFPTLDRHTDTFNYGELVTIMGRTATGKCHAAGTGIIMFDGKIKKVEEIKNGDILMGPDSLPRRVLATGSGLGELFEIIPAHGEKFIVNGDHLLSLRDNGSIKYLRPQKKRPRRRIGMDHRGEISNITVYDYLEKSNHYKHIHKLWRVGIDFPEKKVNLDPYFLGLWLGDGTSCRQDIITKDMEIIDYLKKYAESLDCSLSETKDKKRTKSYKISRGKRGQPSPLLDIMRKYKLINNKHIPKEFLYNDRKIRLNLLAGLIDSDGEKSGNSYTFVNTKECLADDVLYLSRSLGFNAYKKVRIKKTNFLSNRLFPECRAFYVFIGGPIDQIPIRVMRKKAHTSIFQSKPRYGNIGFRIKSCGYGKYYGFELDSDGLYLLDSFIVNHNTFLGLNVLMNMARGNREDREKFGFFSMEQPQSAIFERLLQIFSGKTRYDLKLMEEFERESIFSQIRNELNSIRIYEKIYSVAEISRIVDEEKFTVIFIDFLDLIRSQESGQSMYQQASQKMRELKQTAKTNNCLVILLVQLSRAAGSGDVPVTMEMCRDSGQIEELSDFLFGIWREKSNGKENQDPYCATINLSLLKNKRGPIQNIKCRFDKKIGLIRELEFEKKEFS